MGNGSIPKCFMQGWRVAWDLDLHLHITQACYPAPMSWRHAGSTRPLHVLRQHSKLFVQRWGCPSQNGGQTPGAVRLMTAEHHPLKEICCQGQFVCLIERGRCFGNTLNYLGCTRTVCVYHPWHYGCLTTVGMDTECLGYRVCVWCGLGCSLFAPHLCSRLRVAVVYALQVNLKLHAPPSSQGCCCVSVIVLVLPVVVDSNAPC